MTLKALNPSDFALPSKRVFPIHTKSHVRRALQLFDSAFISDDDKEIINAFGYSTDDIREIHKNLMMKAKEYYISTSWHKCPLCNEREKVQYT